MDHPNPPPPWPGPHLRTPIGLTHPWLIYLVAALSLVVACTVGFSVTVLRVAAVADLQALIDALRQY